VVAKVRLSESKRVAQKYGIRLKSKIRSQLWKSYVDVD